MKELLFAIALCIGIGSGWAFYQAPGQDRVEEMMVVSINEWYMLKHERERWLIVTGALAAGAAVFLVAGASVARREKREGSKPTPQAAPK